MTCTKNRDLGQRILKDFHLICQISNYLQLLARGPDFAVNSQQAKLKAGKYETFFHEIDPEIANIGRKECKVLVFHFC